VLVGHRADQLVALCAEAAAKQLGDRRDKTQVAVKAATCAENRSSESVVSVVQAPAVADRKFELRPRTVALGRFARYSFS